MDFSAANKKFVFPAFTYALGTGVIKGYSDNNISLSFITKPIPTTGSNIFDMNSPFLTYYAFKSLEDNTVQDSLQYVTNVYDISVNKDTETSSTNTYEGMCGIPAEFYLFTKGQRDRISACPITGDIDYTVNALKSKRLSAYFRTEYDMSAKYDRESDTVVGPYAQVKYQEFGIPEVPVTESMPCKKADAFVFQDRSDLQERRVNLYHLSKKGQNGIMDYDGHCLGYGAIGFILSYEDDKHQGDKRIPMAYYEFAKPIYSNHDYMKINWNENGFIEAK